MVNKHSLKNKKALKKLENYREENAAVVRKDANQSERIVKAFKRQARTTKSLYK